MSDWRECEVLEKDIILSIKRKPSTITEIAKRIKRSKPTISEAVKRLANQEIVTKTHDYKGDARNTQIEINRDRIKVKKTHTSYLIQSALLFVPLVVSLIISLTIDKIFLVIGCSIGIAPQLIYIIYQAYIKEDKTIVYKNVKVVKKKEPKNSLGDTN